ncbi:DUF397 domain-containing protein [Nocardia miyunensis]|uniref:DUF397 domain-containing protein n=1 Tax=Nocardia miyunensis TaxID=282684 RepID=UPI0009FFA75E|nr:DUF397 domain-containing protein [Nocardia miyunensis]
MSSYSGADRDCVEAAFLDSNLVQARDSENPTGPALIFSPADVFTAGVPAERFEQS